MATAFGTAGATVLNADVRADPKDLDAEVPTHEHIQERGGEAAFVKTDVSDSDEVASVVKAARTHGGVDVMVKTQKAPDRSTRGARSAPRSLRSLRC